MPAVPTFQVSLDDEPQHRWREVAKQYANKIHILEDSVMGDEGYGMFRSMAKWDGVDLDEYVLKFQDASDRICKDQYAEYCQEMTGYASALGLSNRSMTVFNL